MSTITILKEDGECDYYWDRVKRIYKNRPNY